MRSTMIVGRVGPQPKDPYVEQTRPTAPRMFAAGMLKRRVRVPSERYWQAHWVTESGHLIYGYLDLQISTDLTREKAGLA